MNNSPFLPQLQYSVNSFPPHSIQYGKSSAYEEFCKQISIELLVVRCDFIDFVFHCLFSVQIDIDENPKDFILSK